MSDVLKMIKELENRLFTSYGDPIANYKQTQHDVHMTYYVGRLMEERGHEYITPKDKDEVEHMKEGATVISELTTRIETAMVVKNIMNISARKDTLREIIDETTLSKPKRTKLYEAIRDSGILEY